MIIFIFLIGAALGSFLNVCIYRLPRNISIVKPDSFCPHCHKSILWYDNIPLLSFLFLKGKCRFCKGPISIRYFMVELLTAIIVTFLFVRFELSPSFFIYLVFTLSLIIVSFIDIEHFLIPDIIVYPGIFLGLLFTLFFPEIMSQKSSLLALRQSFLGVISGAGSLFLLGVLGKFFLKKDAMGGGDIKLLGMIGAFLGLPAILLTIFFSSLIGSIVSIILILLKIKKREDYIPFGPYLACGALISLFFKGFMFLGFYIP